MTHQLHTAHIDWQTDNAGNTVPVSTQFDDVYFSKTGGFAETNYVFLQGNQLPERFANLQANQCFVIGETGFGTGLNFIATCILWQQLAPINARLHFISTEKFPLTRTDLSTALSHWQDDDSQKWINALLEQYPIALSGCHRLHFDGNITLDLWYGDAFESLTTLADCQDERGLDHGVDAWFLDGFSPNKNSDLWSDKLFAALARLSHQNSSLATFTAAGFVRRGLEQAGFIVQKTKGFGHKREMITAQFAHDSRTHAPIKPQHIAIIGAGISGVMTALALSRRGHQITLIDQNPPMSGASGNPRALLAPKLTLLASANEHLPTVSYLYAWQYYRTLTRQFDGIFTQTGVVDFLLPTQKSAEKLANQIAEYPDELIKKLDHHDYDTAKIAAFVPTGGLINPAKIAQLIQQNPAVTFVQAAIAKIHESLDGVQLIDTQGDTIQADQAVICAGFLSDQLHSELFACRKIRGQLSWANLPTPIAHPVKYDGYCASFNDGEPMLLFGASFVRNDTNTDLRADEHQFNFDKLSTALPNVANAIDKQNLTGKVGIRAQTPDYHPLVGKVPSSQRLHTLYGMGSKGFGFAPFCAEILADLITGEILPISAAFLAKLSPNRPRLQQPLTD